ncbi:uncharacterized protein LOC124596619 isoform X2 [Schistocerca americana]|uniref:uncharacterized protein LOC124596619 isoform X2 n=1 Tax=Schistocerca americana TaxID=7009 RepID=UPI001F4F1516|nr:uncharacterized protein LOC124596619 isoform X2 [Schistocerca americana]XP_049953056.1 uncharacterized protein LOC126469812 isoform X2 [Schistocerca serialis cubense]
MLPQLNHCCCGCSLQTGSILIGAYQLVRGLFEMISEILLVWDGFPYIEAILGILKIIAALVLIFGANKERHRLIFWCLIINVALLIIDAALFPLTIVIFFVYANTVDAVVTLLLGLGDFGLELYFLWVVFSYYRIIEERAPGVVASV